MTEQQLITTEDETAETRLILPPINYAAPGSRKLDKERRVLTRAFTEAVAAYNEGVDDLNDARSAVIASPIDLEAHTTFKAALERHKSEQQSLDTAREAYHQFLIGRMVTNDGTSVDEALDGISMDDFNALVTGDVESVSIPKPGAASSSGG